MTMAEVINNGEWADSYACSLDIDNALTDLSTQDGFDPFWLETQFVPNQEMECDYCNTKARWKFTYRATGVLQECAFRYCDREFVAKSIDHRYCKPNHTKAEAKHRAKDRKKELNGKTT